MLSLPENNIAYVNERAFLGLTDLQQLDLSYNEIQQLTGPIFIPLVNLRTLDISYNQLVLIENIVMNGLHKLGWLNLDRNQLSHIQPIFRELNLLKKLWASWNPTCSIKDSSFSGLKTLEELHLGCSEILHISNSIFSHLQHLTKLSIKGSCMLIVSHVSFVGLHSLNTLEIYGCFIPYLPANLFMPMTQIQLIKITQGNISKFCSTVLAGVQHLRYLDLTSNQLLSLPPLPHNAKKLRTFKASYNQVGGENAIEWYHK